MSHISMDLLWIKLFCRLDSFERMSLYQSHLFETAYVQDVFNQPFSSWIQDSFCTLLNIFNPNSSYYLRLMKLPNGISKPYLCLWRNAYDFCVTYCFRCVWIERLSFYSTRFQTFLFHMWLFATYLSFCIWVRELWRRQQTFISHESSLEMIIFRAQWGAKHFVYLLCLGIVSLLSPVHNWKCRRFS